MQKSEDAVNGILDAMHQRGVSEYTIKWTNWSVYRPIINWHREHGTEICSFKLLDSLCQHQEDGDENGEISRKFYRSFVTVAL